MARFHPDLKNAWLVPRAVFSRRTFRLVRFANRLAARLAPKSSTTLRLGNGQQVLLHRPARPAATPTPALLWIHGGGLVIGSPRFEDKFCAAISEALGIIVAAPSYRLAPQHPYPAAIDDVADAFTWLAAQPDVDAAHIAVGGDSAGGGLAACLAIRLSEGDGPAPCFQLLHEPMLDEATCRRPDPDPSSLRMWSADANRFAWRAYLAGADTPPPATASAARIEDADMARLPPAWLGIGTADLFHAETADYARRLTNAGVATEFYTMPGGYHGFATVSPRAPVSQAYVGAMKQALARGLGLEASPEPA